MPRFELHGLTLAVRGLEGWPEASSALRSRLAALPYRDGRDGRDGDTPPDLTFEICRSSGPGHDLERPDRIRSIYDPPLGEVVYDERADLLYIEHGPRMRALCEPAAGRARFSAIQPDENDLWLLSHPLFSLPFVEMLKRRGLYSLHAAGLSANGRALILPGTSGSGKSTLAVALARAGLGFLGDDTLFLSSNPEGLRVLAFPDEVDLTEQSVAFFPEVAPWLTPATEGWQKRQLPAGRLFGPEKLGDRLGIRARRAGLPADRRTPQEPPRVDRRRRSAPGTGPQRPADRAGLFAGPPGRPRLSRPEQPLLPPADRDRPRQRRPAPA